MNKTRQRKYPQLNRGGGPGRDRGRVQQAAQWEFRLSDVISTADLARRAYRQRILIDGLKLKPWHYEHARDVLGVIAERAGRVPGRSLLWRLKPE